MIIKTDVLPDWTFVGGATQNFELELRTEYGGYYDIPDATASLSATPFVDSSYKVIQKPASIVKNSAGAYCVVQCTLSPTDTVNLRGKYIYQVTVKNSDGTVAPPMRGRLYIAENIDKSFIS